MSQVDVTTALETGAAKSGRGASGALLRWAILHYHVILAAGAVAGIVTALGMLLLVDRKYEGSAVLAVVSPKISSDLKPASLTVQGYQKLLESDAVLDETRRLLLQQGRLQPKEKFRLKDELETRIFVSRYAENVTLAPMVQLVVAD